MSILIHSPLESYIIDIYKHLLRKINKSNVKENKNLMHETFYLFNRIGPNDVYLTQNFFD